MSVVDNPVVDFGKAVVTMTGYVVVVLAGFELGTWIYRKTSPVVKTTAQKAYHKTADAAKRVRTKIAK